MTRLRLWAPAALVMGLALAAALPFAAASPVTWTLTNLQFFDYSNLSATGTLAINPDWTLDTYDIRVFSSGALVYEFTPANVQPLGIYERQGATITYEFNSGPAEFKIESDNSQPLDDAGDVLPIDGFYRPPSGVGGTFIGDMTSIPVPEPDSWLLLGTGVLGLLGLAQLRRRGLACRPPAC